MKSININELDINANNKVIDIREHSEIKGGMMEGAIHIPMNGLLLNPDQFLNKDEVYYIYCQGGGRSANVCMVLSSQNYQVVNLEGGYLALQK